MLLWAQRPLRSHPTELLLLVWVLGLFTAFSLATLKREPYLTTMVPGIGLMIGYLYHRSGSSSEGPEPMSPLLRVFLVILALVFIGECSSALHRCAVVGSYRNRSCLLYSS